MTTENTTSTAVEKKFNTRPGLVAGIILILVGLMALAQQFIRLDWLGLAFLPTLALIFMATGLIYKKIGLIIPGGILAGIGAGAIASETLPLGEPQDGARFLLIFAAGWALITLLSAVLHLRDRKQEIAWWALIPGTIIGLIGAAILIGGTALKALELLGQGWPVILIALGLYILLRRKQVENRES